VEPLPVGFHFQSDQKAEGDRDDEVDQVGIHGAIIPLS
jgi:hypothetical protein